MRISLLSTMKGYYGGEVHLVDLALELKNRGHEVTCLVHRGGSLQERLLALGLPTEGLAITQWYQAVHLARLRGCLQQTGSQILHSHNPRDYFIAAAAAWKLDVANVGTRHQLRPMTLPHLKKPFLQGFCRMIAVSDAVGKSMLASGIVPADKVVTIANGTHIPQTLPAADPHSGGLHLECGATMTDPMVGMVGRLAPEKGIETAIRAVGRLKEKWPRLKLCLVGDDEGGRKGYLRQLQTLVSRLELRETVHFVGYKPGAQLAARQFDVLVVASEAEPFGLVTIEAMAQGCPVVVTNTGGSPEIVRDGLEGFLFDPGDDQCLSRRLEVLLESRGLNRQMGRAGYARAKEYFNLELMVDRTEEVYREALLSRQDQLSRKDASLPAKSTA